MAVRVWPWCRAGLQRGDALVPTGRRTGKCNIGLLYENGRGVAQDYGEATRWYRIAADNGGVGGQINVGRLYENSRGVPQDYGEAMRWYRKAADQGEAAAQYHIGAVVRERWGAGHRIMARLRAGTAWPWTRATPQRGPILGGCICVGTAGPPTKGMPRRGPLSVSCSSMAVACRGTMARRCAGSAWPRTKEMAPRRTMLDGYTQMA
jgi:TPR repeat protein